MVWCPGVPLPTNCGLCSARQPAQPVINQTKLQEWGTARTNLLHPPNRQPAFFLSLQIFPVYMLCIYIMLGPQVHLLTLTHIQGWYLSRSFFFVRG